MEKKLTQIEYEKKTNWDWIWKKKLAKLEFGY